MLSTLNSPPRVSRTHACVVFRFLSMNTSSSVNRSVLTSVLPILRTSGSSSSFIGTIVLFSMRCQYLFSLVLGLLLRIWLLLWLSGIRV